MQQDNLVVASGSVRDDTERSTDLVGQLGHSIDSGISDDLDAYKD
jgi:hypothetical protein